MIVKLYTETKDLDQVWVDFDLNKHDVSGFWNIPEYVDEEAGIVIYTDEYNIVMGGSIVTIKECSDLIEFLKYKFEK